MPWDRKRLLGYVETIQLILGVTDKQRLKGQLVTTAIHMRGNRYTIIYTTW